MKPVTPLISVITTVYNCERYIKESIESILNQTYDNFEYIILDDGSTDNTAEIIKQLSDSDKRIIFLRSGENLGRVWSLNKALEKSKGNFIAIQDADDISMPERFEKQIDFFRDNPEYVLLGTDISVIDDSGKIISKPVRPVNNEEIRFNLLFKCTLANPSVMYRKEILTDNNLRYEEDFSFAEDFRLFSHLIKHGKVYNLKERQIMYRNHSVNSTNKNIKIISEHSAEVVVRNFKDYGLNIDPEDAVRIRKLMSLKGMEDIYLLKDMKLILSLIKMFQERSGNIRNEEVISTLKKMLKWPGKKNTLSNPKFSRIQISILKYYIKQAKLRKSNS